MTTPKHLEQNTIVFNHLSYFHNLISFHRYCVHSKTDSFQRFNVMFTQT